MKSTAHFLTLFHILMVNTAVRQRRKKCFIVMLSFAMETSLVFIPHVVMMTSTSSVLMELVNAKMTVKWAHLCQLQVRIKYIYFNRISNAD